MATSELNEFLKSAPTPVKGKVNLERYVVMNDAGEFMALDDASGGYPYFTTFGQATFWSKLIVLVNYWSSFRNSHPEARIVKLNIEVEEIEDPYSGPVIK